MCRGPPPKVTSLSAGRYGPAPGVAIGAAPGRGTSMRSTAVRASRRRLTGAVALCALVLAACGGDDDDDATGTTTASIPVAGSTPAPGSAPGSAPSSAPGT